MTFDLQSGMGAGSGADMLQQILRQRAQEAFQQGTLQNEAQRNALLAQEAQARNAYMTEALKSAQEERAQREEAQKTVQAGLAAHQLTPQTAYDPTNPAIKLISANPVYAGTLSQDTTLPSANITGSADTSGGPLKITNLAATPNPAKPTGQVRFAGLPDQLATQNAQAALERIRQTHPEIADALELEPDPTKRASAVADYVKNLSLQPKPEKTEGVFRQNPATGSVERLTNGQWTPWAGDTPPGSHWMTEPPAKTGTYSFQTMTGPDNMPVLLRGNAMTGDIQPVALPQGVTAGKPSGQSMMKAEDRKRAAAGLDQLDAAINNASSMIGPGAGRVSTIEQMIGNPDPRVQALGTKMLMAKMTIDAGIGGARAAASPQLLQRWDNLFSQKLTPEALHATVQAMREMLNAGQTAPSSSGFKVEKIQ